MRRALRVRFFITGIILTTMITLGTRIGKVYLRISLGSLPVIDLKA